MRQQKVLQLNEGGLFLFPPDIWKFHYEFDYDILQPKIDLLFATVEKNSKLEYGDALSTVSIENNLQPHTWYELTEFQQWLGAKIADIRRVHAFTSGYSEVTSSWFNKHLKDGITLEHNHNYSTFVVTSYICLPKDSGYIEFKDPLEYHKNSYPIYPEESLYKEVPCKTNDVLIFPGWLKHRVQPNKSNEERIVMTFNIK
jgi:uncharacterized protein (TIGR02466 family)